MSHFIYGTHPPFVEAEEVAGIVRSLTDKDDRIFIAGSEPEIYFHARRRSATPFVICYAFTYGPSFADRYQQRAIDMLKSRPPKVIVYSPFTDLIRRGVTQKLHVFLHELLRARYVLVGCYVRPLKSTQGQWKQAPLRRTEMQDSSLLVFKRRE
jgi:hypothetical protein